MKLTKPTKAHTAESNVEAHLIVNYLVSKGIPAHAIEDQSGVSLPAIGPIGQFHKPNIWVEESSLEDARAAIDEFETRKRERAKPSPEGEDLLVTCEDCGKVTTFPYSLDGTTQECRHCHAYVDVGDLPWEEDFGEPID